MRARPRSFCLKERQGRQRTHGKRKNHSMNTQTVRNSVLALIGLAIMILLILSALLAPWIARYDPNEIDLYKRSKPPSAMHWLGTDETGRDVWARMVYAGRVSMSVGIVAVAISAVIASPIQ